MTKCLKEFHVLPDPKVRTEKRPDPLKHELGEVNDRNIGVLRKLTQATFPIKYGERFYQDVLANSKLCRYAFVADVVVGSICTRVQLATVNEQASEKFDDGCTSTGEATTTVVNSSTTTTSTSVNGTAAASTSNADSDAKVDYSDKIVYIMALSLLPAYRRGGIATSLLNWFLEAAKKEGVKTVALHVQTSNEVALEFYKKYGFTTQKTVENYYAKLEPASAYYLTKSLA
ncbi:unnamed protein product [Amoebophrya sp. A25]|nr:unnamed protein product [Amoebophrya sp. A25]|eukprot:GSA25T00011626001.1